MEKVILIQESIIGFEVLHLSLGLDCFEDYEHYFEDFRRYFEGYGVLELV